VGAAVALALGVLTVLRNRRCRARQITTKLPGEERAGQRTRALESERACDANKKKVERKTDATAQLLFKLAAAVVVKSLRCFLLVSVF
jgi:hypothetical protein